jgi:5-methylcytosine-specific restriction protein A
MTVPGRHQIALPPSGKAPSGRPICRWCRKEIPVGTGRRNWCSQDCVDEYLVRKSPVSARDQTFARDRGVCAVCHIDTERVRRIRDFLHARATGWASPTHGPWWRSDSAKARWERFAQWITANVAASGAKYGAHLWEADHLVPVAEGGGACGLENLRTLCKRCHAVETGQLRRRLNQARSPQLRLPQGSAG